VGSLFWGEEVVEALRDNVEATLRGIMAEAEATDLETIPTFKKGKD
jgi:hypothetical protein